MSLGGYKFRGYYCQKGSLTDAQWALLMHKTKVAAFMAANTAASAGWDYDMTGSPDGNYHCLDSVGNNYVTVFKRTNGENDYTWFAIYTLTKFTWSGTDTGAVKLYIQANYTFMFYGYYACNFYRIGTAQIAYSDSLATAPASMSNVTGCLPVGNPGTSSSDISSSYYPPSNSSTKDMSSVYYGFAVKSDSVVMFQGGSASTSSLCCSVASGHAFSSFVNNGDMNGVFAYNTQVENASSNNYENATRNAVTTTMDSKLCVCANKSGGINYSTWFSALPLAVYSTSVQEYPFQSLQVFGVDNTAPATSGKGSISIDLMAINFPGANQGLVPSVYSTFANGNYLVVRCVSGSYYLSSYCYNAVDTVNWNAALYVGWDPSNPDITQASAWTEFVDS